MKVPSYTPMSLDTRATKTQYTCAISSEAFRAYRQLLHYTVENKKKSVNSGDNELNALNQQQNPDVEASGSQSHEDEVSGNLSENVIHDISSPSTSTNKIGVSENSGIKNMKLGNNKKVKKQFQHTEGNVENYEGNLGEIGEDVGLLAERMEKFGPQKKEKESKISKQLPPNSIEARIDLALKDTSRITELNLDDCEASEITGVTDAYINLESLSLKNVGLSSLRGLPVLPNLTTLDLSNNQISGELDVIARNCPKLLTLVLSGNKIMDFKELLPLKDLNLSQLDLVSNPVCEDQDYTDKVSMLLENILMIIDGGPIIDDEEDFSYDSEYVFGSCETAECESGDNFEAEDNENKGEYEEDVSDGLRHSLEERIDLVLKDPTDIIKLNLDNCEATEITGFSDGFVNLRHLSFRNVGLKSLQGLPLLPSLVSLDLSHNQFEGGLEIVAKNCPNLQRLVLTGNKIEDIDALLPLKDTCIFELDLVSNPICKKKNYRDGIFDLIEKVNIIDGLHFAGPQFGY